MGSSDIHPLLDQNIFVANFQPENMKSLLHLFSLQDAVKRKHFSFLFVSLADELFTTVFHMKRN